MEFYIYKKREKIFDYFKPKKGVILTYRKTLGKILGVGGGYKTDIISDEELTKRGETKRIVELLANTAKERKSKVPFALSRSLEKELSDYEIRISPSYINLGYASPFYREECKESGIRLLPDNKYEIID